MLSTGGAKQQHQKMSIAFLSGEASSLRPVKTATCGGQPKHIPPSASNVLGTRLQTSHGNPRRRATAPSSAFVSGPRSLSKSDSVNPAPGSHLVTHNGVMKESKGVQRRRSSTSVYISRPDTTILTTPKDIYFSIALRPNKLDATKRNPHDADGTIFCDTISSSGSLGSSPSSHEINNSPASQVVHRSFTGLARTLEPPSRPPRKVRPSYSEEQKFFIMYKRIVMQLSWAAIEDQFTTFFDTRSRDGLTSAYYRIRRSWGMREVTRTKPLDLESDTQKIFQMAMSFTRQFLENVGLEGRDVPPGGLEGGSIECDGVKEAVSNGRG